MKLNRIAKKYIAICSILLLLFSLNISTNVSAKLVEDPDYGVAYDEFDDATNITSENCSAPANGTIKLAFTKTSITYDLDAKRDNIKAWMMTESPLKGLEGPLTKFLNPDLFLLSTLAYEINDDDDLDDMAKDDSITFKTAGAIGPGAVPSWPMNLFRFEIDHDKDVIDELEFSWRFGDYKTGTNLEGLTMYAWSYGDRIPYWNYLINATYPTGLNNTNGYLSIIKKITNFISDEGIIDVLIVGKPQEGIIDEQTYLHTDYIMVKTTIKKGYLSDGWVKSSFIEPTTFYGWERIFWSGSRPSANSYIKIKVLDQNEKEIPEEDLEGNSDGFTDSPIDISLLDSDKYPKIMLEALLHSEDIEFTPSLNSWGVLWQTKEGFYDSFKHDFRVDESYGVEINTTGIGEIRISEFYSDWPIFGKNSANTRAYAGKIATVEKNETYWRTSKDLDFGGGFRSPVVSNGRVYIASSDNKIYAFNLTTDDPGEVESPVTESKANYTVDSSVAVTDDLVILATSNLSNSKSNKIFALYSTNLSKKWHYPDEDFSNTICFSSAPTIANGRVFVTSWSGIFGNNPIISYLYNKLDNLLGDILGLNNKLFAIDINTGSLIWKDPIDLPAGSFSTPAVDNGLVFVGCENMQGPSLFAFDENSGEEVWNASVGMIGRSSPVVADGKVLVLSREQPSNFTFKGNDKVFALDAETGEEIWNITLGSNTSILGNMLKVYGVDNLIATFAPASTPAVYADSLFVMSPNGTVYAFDIDTGEENWNFDAAAEIPGFDLTPYYCASPVVVDGIVYIAASESFLRERSFIFALDNPKDGEVKVLWEYELIDPEYTELVVQQHFIFASPVVTDGLVLISERRLDIGTSTYHGRIQVIGEYKRNLMGKVYSVPIHVQKGKWWKEFNADILPTSTTNNTVTFSIFDENGNELMTGLNGTHNNISSIRGDVIQLGADLNIRDEEEDEPVLKSWEISWTPENKKPEFIDNTFKPGQEGWINPELKYCSIEVRDIGVNGIISGLNVDSAKFDLVYVSDTNEIITKTFKAICEGESGDERVKVIAEISKLGIEIKDLKNITFKIKDLAGNENTSNTFTFKIDAEKPTSEITNKDVIKDKSFNTEVIVNVKAHDPEGGSGISNVALNYRYRNSTAAEWGSWETFSKVPDIYNWSFGINVTTGKPMDSGYYQIITIAEDKADNKEDVDENKIVSFLFDMKPPIMETLSGEYKSKKIPTFNLEINDDFKLDAIYYRPSPEAEWKLIIDDIDEATYSETWSLPYDIWVNMMEGEEHGIYIFFKITDWCENEYITTTTNSPFIIKDENISELYLDMSDFQERPWDNKFKISANIPDDIVVETLKLYYRYSENDEKWSEWKQYGDNLTEEPFEWEFKVKDGSGYYEFRTEIIDTSGFVYTSPVEFARVTLFPTTLVILMIVLIVILLPITIFVIKNMKKKKE